MFQPVDVANFALRHLGVESEIASLKEKSVEARTLNSFFKLARENTLRGFPWQFAMKIDGLALVDEFIGDDDRGYGYRYAYAYPANALRVFMVLDRDFSPRRGGIPTEYFDDAVYREHVKRNPFRQFLGNQGKEIHTDVYQARVAMVSRDAPDVDLPSDYVLALSYFLAYLSAPTLARGNDKIKQEMLIQYKMAIGEAKATSLNEEEPEPEAESEFIRSRY